MEFKFEPKFCVVYDWEHSEGIDEDNSIVFSSIRRTKQEVESLEDMEKATNIRVYELKPTTLLLS